MWRVYTTLLLTLLCSVRICAQIFPADFEVITADNGLPNNYVWSVLQDRAGRIWLGTSDGLCLYDGYTFIIYRREDRDDSIPATKITRIQQDGSGKLWLGTENEGIGLFDPYTNSSINFRHDPKDPNTLSNNYITSIYIDRKSRVWIVTRNGLNRYIPQKRGFDRYFFSDNQPNLSKFNHLFQMTELSDGRMLITTDGGVVEFNPDSGAFKQHRISINNANVICLSILHDSSGRVWIGSFKDGLFLYDVATAKARQIPLPINTFGINALLEFDSKRLLLGLQGGGIIVLNTESLQIIEHIDRNKRGSTNISSNFITSFYRDRTGILWIGSETGGLLKYTPYRNRFKLYRSDPRNPNSMSDQMVRGIAVDRRQRLWVATQVGGLNVYDPATDLWRNYRSKTGSRSLPNDNTTSVLVDREGQIWVGVRNTGGLCKLLPDEKGFDCILCSEQTGEQNVDLGVNQIIQDRRGTIWVGTDHGLRRLEQGRIPLVFEKKYLDVQSIYEAADGMLWIGSSREGVIVFDPKEMRLVRSFKNQPQDLQSLSHNFVTAITEDSKGRLIIATKGGGINVCTDRIQGKFKRLGVSEGLPHQNIYSCLEDSTGNLWLSSDMGLCRYNLDNGKSYIFTRKDGLQHNEFNRFSYYKSVTGEFYFGGINGLNSFRPEQVHLNTRIPQLSIIKLTKLSEPTQLLIHPDTTEIVLKHTDQYFTIEFSVLDYAVPLRNRFKYRMEGLADKWMDLKEGEHSVTFTGLQPGEYRFSIQGSNNDGVWSEQTHTLKIRITPPWWRSSLAYSTYALFLIGAIWGGFKLRISSLNSRTRLLEQTVEERTREVVRQRDEIEEQRTKILDSIKYAEQIQKSILPDVQQLREHFQDCFILNRPKDIVSGDFYWLHKLDRELILAIVDCTGHGVPGALMSIIGEMLLAQIVVERRVSNPAEILLQMHSGIRKLLKQGEKGASQDGMEIAICTFTDKHSLLFAGARQHLYYTDNSLQIKIIRGDRWPVGGLQREKNRSYTLHTIPLDNITNIYLATDGLQDQPGISGKFGRKRLLNMLETVSSMEMELQQREIARVFTEYMGDREQRDDITLIGIRPG